LLTASKVSVYILVFFCTHSTPSLFLSFLFLKQAVQQTGKRRQINHARTPNKEIDLFRRKTERSVEAFRYYMDSIFLPTIDSSA